MLHECNHLAFGGLTVPDACGLQVEERVASLLQDEHVDGVIEHTATLHLNDEDILLVVEDKHVDDAVDADVHLEHDRVVVQVLRPPHGVRFVGGLGCEPPAVPPTLREASPPT